MSRPLCVNDCKILPVSKEMTVLDAFESFWVFHPEMCVGKCAF